MNYKPTNVVYTLDKNDTTNFLSLSPNTGSKHGQEYWKNAPVNLNSFLW